jgi:hypothetical protein
MSCSRLNFFAFSLFLNSTNFRFILLPVFCFVSRLSCLPLLSYLFNSPFEVPFLPFSLICFFRFSSLATFKSAVEHSAYRESMSANALPVPVQDVKVCEKMAAFRH